MTRDKLPGRAVLAKLLARAEQTGLAAVTAMDPS
jgi:hypothetical protein